MPPLYSTGPFGLSTSTMQPSTRPSASPNTATISLISNAWQDRRVITLRSGESVKIGRASKSEVKNLQPADDNALFDCPVVSRQHAELRFSAWKPSSEQVTIIDLASLHGTTVNGRRVESEQPFSLKSGDVIKLGERVTRGDDTHDGMSLTYTRLGEMPSTQYHDLSPVGPSFQVPLSPSEHDQSDYESDMESIRSVAKDGSSAHTTPDSNKIKLGSQDKPIFIGDSVPAPVIDLSGGEQDEDAVQPAQRHVIPDTYDEDNESLVAEEDDVDEGAYVASDNESVDKDSVRGLEDGHQSVVFDDEDEEEDIEENQDIFPDDDISEDADRFSDGEGSGFVAPVFARDDDFAAPADNFKEKVVELLNTTNIQAQAVNNPFTEPKPRYDPVRNSQPPTDNEAAKSVPAPASIKPTRPYEPFGPGSNYLNPATNCCFSSRWDVRPPGHSTFGYFPKPAPVTAPAPIPDAFENYLDPQPFAPLLEPFANTNPWYTAPQQPMAPLPTPTAASFQPQTPVVHDTTITATSSKISIPNIIEKDSVSNEASADAELSNITSPAGNKRKASEMEADEVDQLAAPPATEVTTPTATPRSKRRRTRRQGTGTVREVTVSLAKYTGAAVAGAAATVAFLNSPAAQWVIDYLG
ncbi:hypothetical protein PRZ48_004674 [Zasmidium cellare]|uniref:FHA domain-containing protein n=1 Tax=Zasmidium cellare TaxID=395010 RepID=A0ABR0EQV4_ZASCE|nr:hypothetical protein PRZ48_004674 [Zasmidium cellare]